MREAGECALAILSGKRMMNDRIARCDGSKQIGTMSERLIARRPDGALNRGGSGDFKTHLSPSAFPKANCG